MKQEAFFVIFEGFLLKEIKTTFLEDESLTLNQKVSKNLLLRMQKWRILKVSQNFIIRNNVFADVILS